VPDPPWSVTCGRCTVQSEILRAALKSADQRKQLQLALYDDVRATPLRGRAPLRTVARCHSFVTSRAVRRRAASLMRAVC
jgi:hypothetical protein